MATLKLPPKSPRSQADRRQDKRSPVRGITPAGRHLHQKHQQLEKQRRDEAPARVLPDPGRPPRGERPAFGGPRREGEGPRAPRPERGAGPGGWRDERPRGGPGERGERPRFGGPRPEGGGFREGPRAERGGPRGDERPSGPAHGGPRGGFSGPAHGGPRGFGGPAQGGWHGAGGERRPAPPREGGFRPRPDGPPGGERGGWDRPRDERARGPRPDTGFHPARGGPDERPRFGPRPERRDGPPAGPHHGHAPGSRHEPGGGRPDFDGRPGAFGGGRGPRREGGYTPEGPRGAGAGGGERPRFGGPGGDRPRFGGPGGSAGERPRFGGSGPGGDRPRFDGRGAAGGDRPRFGGPGGDRPRFGGSQGSGGGRPGFGGPGGERPRFGADRGPARFHEGGPRDERPRFGPHGGRPGEGGRGERPRQDSGRAWDAGHGPDRPGERAREAWGERPRGAWVEGPREPWGRAPRGPRPERRDGPPERHGPAGPQGGRDRPWPPQPTPARGGFGRPAARFEDEEDDELPAHAPGSLRLSKRLAELGHASRREADDWIAAGWVKVDGQVVDTLGARVLPHQQVEIDPRARELQARQVTVLLHKPVGLVSGQAEDGHQPAITLVTPENRWGADASGIDWQAHHLRHLAVAGRLDVDSSGLLVLTQDGRVARTLIGEREDDDEGVEKEYLVEVAWFERPELDADADLKALFPEDRVLSLRHGLSLDGKALRPARVSWQNETTLRFVLREGRKRQIRRMCELVGLKVLSLRRVRIGRVVLASLPPGQWRYLAPWEKFD